jgi:hypothetical protein
MQVLIAKVFFLKKAPKVKKVAYKDRSASSVQVQFLQLLLV